MEDKSPHIIVKDLTMAYGDFVVMHDLDFTINRRDRIAQLVLAPVSRARVTVAASLDHTARQDGGFGHTGI